MALTVFEVVQHARRASRVALLAAPLLAVPLFGGGMLAGCNRKAADPETPVPVAEPVFRAPLTSLVPPDSPAWVEIDLAQLRTWEPAAPLAAAWAAAPEDAQDVLSVGMRDAERWLALIPDAAVTQRLHVVRTPVTALALAQEASRPDNFAGQRLEPVGQQGAMVWMSRQSGQAASVAAQDLLLTGDYASVRSAVHVVRTSTNPATETSTDVVRGRIRLTSMHRAALLDQFEGALADPFFGGLQQIDLRVALTPQPQLLLQVAWTPNTREALIRSLLAAAPNLLREQTTDPLVHALLDQLQVDLQTPVTGPVATLLLTLDDAQAHALATLAAAFLQQHNVPGVVR